MADPCDVRWYTFSWNDVLRLPMPEEVKRAEVEVLIDREGETLRFWGERESQVLGLFRWDWVREDFRIAEWRLEDWFGIFHDLRIFFYVHQPAEGTPSVHILAVQEDGGVYLTTQGDDLLRRYGEMLGCLGEESSPGTARPGN